ncbi:2Fe-2S iron-sulfur cluster-binding protein [Paenibacillus sp. TH7-28]
MSDAKTETKRLYVERRESARSEPYTVCYEVPYEEGMTHMDALRFIADELDPSFAFYEHSCKRGFCGACLIQVDDKKLLSCRSLLPSDRQVQVIKPALKVDKDYYPWVGK